MNTVRRFRNKRGYREYAIERRPDGCYVFDRVTRVVRGIKVSQHGWQQFAGPFSTGAEAMERIIAVPGSKR